MYPLQRLVQRACGQHFAGCILSHKGNFKTKKTIKKQLRHITSEATETLQSSTRAEQAWSFVVLASADFDRARNQAFDQHAKSALWDEERCEPEPNSDAVDDFDPHGDELSDGEEEETVEEQPTVDTDPPQRTHSTA